MQSQLILDLQEPVLDHGKYAVIGDPIFQVGMAQIQQVRDLVILREPLAGGGDHYHDPSAVRLYDILHLLELTGICQGATTKLGYL